MEEVRALKQDGFSPTTKDFQGDFNEMGQKFSRVGDRRKYQV